MIWLWIQADRVGAGFDTLDMWLNVKFDGLDEVKTDLCQGGTKEESK